VIRALLLAACLMAAASARSDEAGSESEVPRVSTTGTAERAVPVDGIRVVFGIDTRAATFGAARREADAVLARIRERVARTGLPELEIRDEFRVLEPDAGEDAQGARLRHRLDVTSQHVPGERLQAGVTALIDAGLSSDERVRVSAVEAFVSADRIAEHREAALARATLEARASAERLATSMGAGVGRPLELDWEFTIPPDAPPDVAAGGGVPIEKLASSRERFALERPFSSEITYRAVVRAAFELTPAR
jgi:uncharacterized protein YggE